MNWIILRVIAFAGGRLEGKKTYIFAVGKILLGLVAVISIMFPEFAAEFGIRKMSIEEVITVFGGGYSILSGGQGASERAALTKTTDKVVAECLDIKNPQVLDDEIDRSG